jgi:pimeloyl-ACP methyl ester carboxylesterase
MKIPFHDFGGDEDGERPLLHFAASNAYTPACFQQFINPLLPHYRVISVIHRPLWSDAKLEDLTSWEMLGDDMMCIFEGQGLAHMVGVGHSMGAVATMFAAVKRPSLFNKLVFIEPVVLPPAFIAAAQEDPETLEQVPIIAKARQRRAHWPNRAAAFDHFRRKSAFRHWPDATIWDYVNYGLHEKNGHITLTYSREWEAHCYGLAAYPAWQLIPQITQPTLVIRASETDSLWAESWQLWQEIQPQATFIEIEDAGHMVVMERPSAIAQLVLDFLQQDELH